MIDRNQASFDEPVLGARDGYMRRVVTLAADAFGFKELAREKKVVPAV